MHRIVAIQTDAYLALHVGVRDRILQIRARRVHSMQDAIAERDRHFGVDGLAGDQLIKCQLRLSTAPLDNRHGLGCCVALHLGDLLE